MNTKRSASQFLWKGLLVLFLVVSAFQSFGTPGLAAPNSPVYDLQGGDQPQALACSTSPANVKVCDIQIVLLIDDSGSMAINDPEGIRNQGAKNLVDFLARQYYLPARMNLEAVNSKDEAPIIEIAVVHFTTKAEYYTDWKQVAPKDLQDWENQQVELFKAIDWHNPNERNTDFKEPFEKAAALFMAKNGGAKDDGCTKRMLMLFSDGTPQNGRTVDVKEKMGEVRAIVDGIPPDLNVETYITGFKVKERYWSGVESHWSEIAGSRPDEAVPRSVLLEGEDSLIQMASRMEAITASSVGVQSTRLTPDEDDPQSYSLEIPKHVQSVRLTLYHLNTQAGLQISDPEGAELIADGESVIVSGEDTSIEVWDLDTPPAGSYKLRTTERGGMMTVLLSHQGLSVIPDVEESQPQVGQPGIMRFRLVDSSGDPLRPEDESSILNIGVKQDGQDIPVEWTGDAFQFPWTPERVGMNQFEVQASLNSSDGDMLLDCSGELEIEVPAVLAAEKLSIDVTPPLYVFPGETTNIPLQLTYEGNDPAWASSLEWDPSVEAYPDAQDVGVQVNSLDIERGQYELIIDPIEEEGNIQKLEVHAKAELTGRPDEVSDSKDFTLVVCACGPQWNIWFWILGIILLALLILMLVLKFRPERGRKASQEENQSKLRTGSWHLLFWPLLILLILLILNRFFWCCILPIWLFLALMLAWLIILLLVLFRPGDVPPKRQPWWQAILLALLVLTGYIFFKNLWIYLLGLLLIIFSVTWILRWIRKRSKTAPLWWLMILLALIATIGLILLGGFPLLLIFLLALLLAGILALVWFTFRKDDRRWTWPHWVTLAAWLILGLAAVFLFSAYWAYLLLWLVMILALIGIILWFMSAAAPMPEDDLKIIEGIGPQVEKLLNKRGIHTFRELIDADLDELNGWLDKRGWAYMDPNTWQVQATLADRATKTGIKEDWDEFYKETERLKGGIEPDDYNKPEKDRKPLKKRKKSD